MNPLTGDIQPDKPAVDDIAKRQQIRDAIESYFKFTLEIQEQDFEDCTDAVWSVVHGEQTAVGESQTDE